MKTDPQMLAYSLIGKHRIKAKEVYGKVNNVRIVDDILRKHSYRKVFCGTSIYPKGWAISERYIKRNEYLDEYSA